MDFDVFEFSSKGGRKINEDSCGHVLDGGCGFFVVADGLGGHSHGELASECAVNTLIREWSPSSPDREEWFYSSIRLANEGIMSLQKEQGEVMKSTVAALAIDQEKAVWAHVGDSRVYYIHDGWIKSVTEDHSVAYKKYKAGEISLEDIAFDEDQSRLLRSLGGEDRNEPQIHVLEERLVPGDAFLLCSDGAWEYLKNGEIAIDLLKSENAERWTELLLLRMMDRIAYENDNLTLLAVMLKQKPEK